MATQESPTATKRRKLRASGSDNSEVSLACSVTEPDSPLLSEAESAAGLESSPIETKNKEEEEKKEEKQILKNMQIEPEQGWNCRYCKIPLTNPLRKLTDVENVVVMVVHPAAPCRVGVTGENFVVPKEALHPFACKGCAEDNTDPVD